VAAATLARRWACGAASRASCSTWRRG
jgi:hypothetical protein